MRVLFMPAPAIGHTFPLVPLAWAFRAAGHEVVFVTAGDGLTVADAGLPALDALPGRTTGEMQLGFLESAPELFAPVNGDPIAEMNRRKPHVLAAWEPYVDAHLALAERVRPDLVVYDPIFGVGALAGAKLGVPAVACRFTIARYTPELLRAPRPAQGLQRRGLTLPDVLPTIDLVPPSLAEGPPSELRMRYVPYNGGRVLPEWLLQPPRRPRIAVTFGSLDLTHEFGYVERILAAAPHVDAEFVLALGDRPVPAELPPNVRAVGWVPMNQLLRSCAAAIHHGGGTAMTCCALGVPQLALPEGAPDTLAEAEFLRARGAAHVLRTSDLDAAAIRALLADDKLQRVAAELREEIARMPAPAELVPRLTAMA